MHSLFGLTVACDALLPGIPWAMQDAPPDVRIGVRRTAAPPPVDASWRLLKPGQAAWRRPAGQGTDLRLMYADACGWTDVVIDATGEQVDARLPPEVAFEEVAELLTSTVFSAVLGQRGVTVLHACVVEVDGRAICLVGPKEAGKTSLACALTGAGGALVADDVAVLGRGTQGFTVAAGPPRLRVTEPTAGVAGVAWKELEPIWSQPHGRPAKRRLAVRSAGEDSLRRLVPLGAVYLLEPRDGDTPASVETAGAADAFGALVAERHMAHLLEPAGHRRDFAVLRELTERVPVRRLRRPDGLASLQDTAATVIADVRGL